jgi:hypothetical protein
MHAAPPPLAAAAAGICLGLLFPFAPFASKTTAHHARAAGLCCPGLGPILCPHLLSPFTL